MDVLILAGGLGTRLAGVVSDRAKPVANVGGAPFLLHLLRQVERNPRAGRVVLCVGHMARTVEDAVGDRFGRLPILYSREESPLGTGGALRRAIVSAGLSRTVMVMNGDSYFGIRLERMVAEHGAAGAGVTVALARVREATRYGAARLRSGRIEAFAEKGVRGPAWINAGIYVFSPRAVRDIAAGPSRFSLEREMLPRWCAAGIVCGVPGRARFIDIGTPGDYARAANVLARAQRGSGRTSN